MAPRTASHSTSPTSGPASETLLGDDEVQGRDEIPHGVTMSDELIPSESEILLYTTPSEDVRVEVFYRGETFWLSQRTMAELFGVEVNTINYHCKEIFVSKELAEERTIRKIRVVQKEGDRDVAREDSIPFAHSSFGERRLLTA